MQADTLAQHRPVSGNLHHFEFVDALRGYAILLVLMLHVGQEPPALTNKMRQIFDVGENGVMLFFVVSAFTLFWSMQNRSGVDQHPLKAFYVRRFFRIAPLFWAGMLFYLVHPDQHQAEFAPNGVGWPQVVTTFLFVHGWYPTTINSVVPGGWSIAAEVMFYLCIPLLHKRIKSLCGALWITLTATCVSRLVQAIGQHVLTRYFPGSWAGLIGDFQYWIFPSQFPVFCMGLVLYFVLSRQMSHQPIEPASKRNWAYCLILVALFLSLRQTPDQVIFAGCFVLIAWSLAIHPNRVLVNPVVRYIGLVSYSIYIWHFWILSLLSPHILALVHPFHEAKLNGVMQFAIVYVFVLLFSVLAATVSYFLIEKPSQQMGKHIINNMRWGGVSAG